MTQHHHPIAKAEDCFTLPGRHHSLHNLLPAEALNDRAAPVRAGQVTAHAAVSLALQAPIESTGLISPLQQEARCRHGPPLPYQRPPHQPAPPRRPLQAPPARACAPPARRLSARAPPAAPTAAQPTLRLSSLVLTVAGLILGCVQGSLDCKQAL